MPFSNDKGRAVANTTIGLHLFSKAAQAVVIAFEFEAMQDTINERKINPCSSTPDTQFVNDNSVWICTESPVQVRP
jgi:hypothetical protein